MGYSPPLGECSGLALINEEGGVSIIPSHDFGQAPPLGGPQASLCPTESHWDAREAWKWGGPRGLPLDLGMHGNELCIIPKCVPAWGEGGTALFLCLEEKGTRGDQRQGSDTLICIMEALPE